MILKVMVRYPLDERQSVENLEDLRIRTPDGREMRLDQVADLEITEGFSSITRVDRRRVIKYYCRRRQGRGRPRFNQKASLKDKKGVAGFLTTITDDYPGITWSFQGEAREQADIFASLGQMTLIAIFLIYTLLAVPLKSYVQPVIVMIVIPFGLIGAIGGHILMGQPMSILSVLGFVALAGVVVNDSLVLVDFINHERKEGKTTPPCN